MEPDAESDIFTGSAVSLSRVEFKGPQTDFSCFLQNGLLLSISWFLLGFSGCWVQVDEKIPGLTSAVQYQWRITYRWVRVIFQSYMQTMQSRLTITTPPAMLPPRRKKKLLFHLKKNIRLAFCFFFFYCFDDCFFPLRCPCVFSVVLASDLEKSHISLEKLFFLHKENKWNLTQTKYNTQIVTWYVVKFMCKTLKWPVLTFSPLSASSTTLQKSLYF